MPKKVGSGFRGRQLQSDLIALEFQRQELLMLNERLCRRLTRLRLASLTLLEALPDQVPAAREYLRHEVNLSARFA